MFKAAGVLIGGLIGSAIALTLTSSIPTIAAAGNSPTPVTDEIIADSSGEELGRYTTDGGKTWISIKEQKGVAERIPTGTSKAEFMEAHKMSPEAEAAIVQRVSPVPVIIDGVLYEPEQIHLFDGKQLGFTVGNDGQLYAFTSFAALEDFLAKDNPSNPAALRSYDSTFYEDINMSGSKQLIVVPGVSVPNLGGLDNAISSMQISEFAANDSMLFEDAGLTGLYFIGWCGTPYANLGNYGWNDRASSLVVWPR